MESTVAFGLCIARSYTFDLANRALSRDLGFSFLFKYRYGNGHAPLALVKMEHLKGVGQGNTMVANLGL